MVSPSKWTTVVAYSNLRTAKPLVRPAMTVTARRRPTVPSVGMIWSVGLARFARRTTPVVMPRSVVHPKRREVVGRGPLAALRSLVRRAFTATNQAEVVVRTSPTVVIAE